MNPRLLTAVIVAAIINLPAQTVNITGKVTNQAGRGIAGAVVSMAASKLSATTDASGAYALSGAVAVDRSAIMTGADAVFFKNGMVTVNLSAGVPVSIELFDIQGNLLEKTSDHPAGAGTYGFDLASRPFAMNMLVVRVGIGHRTASFRYYPGVAQTRQVAVYAAAQRFERAQAFKDTLIATALRYTAKRLAISSPSGTVDITLDTAACNATPSVRASATATGSGPHKVVVETNADPGIKCGTIYRPEDLGPGKKYPIFVWGEGGCSQDGLSNRAAMGEIASWGYFIVADGTPTSAGRCTGGQDGKAFLDYITWAIAQNGNPCSAYYQSLDTTKIAADGFSCGGLMSMNVSGDPRFAAIGYTSSGLFAANNTLYSKIHTPIKIMNGGSGDMAYENGLRDYNSISALGKPIIYFSKTSAGHGGDLGNAKGDFNTVNLAWLNWQLKGDTGATGKALLMGSSCKYCNASGWVFKVANIQ